MVDITTLKEYISTGVVIAPHSILTAADKMHVYEQMGNYGELLVNDGQMRHSILMVKTRDGYKKDSVGSYYDIAIVTVSPLIKFQMYQQNMTHLPIFL